MRIAGNIIVAALLLSGFAVANAAAGQDALVTRMLKSQKRWLQFNIIDGRVEFNWTRLVQFNSNSNLTVNGKPANETFKVTNQNGRLQLTYNRNTVIEQLRIVVSGNGDTMTISRTPMGESTIAPLEFVQTPDEKIKLSLGTGENKQTFLADEIWELFLQHPKECEEHLYPLLEMLRSDWKLTETVAKIETHLLLGAGEEVIKRRERWAALVKQLGDDRFARREAADRALRTEGAAVVGYLRRLDFNRLDAEQQFRIRRILDSFNEENKDESPEDVADRLVGNPAVWLALLEKADQSSRETAAKQLAILLGEDIAVDPAADPKTQVQQRERLRAKIEKQ